MKILRADQKSLQFGKPDRKAMRRERDKTAGKSNKADGTEKVLQRQVNSYLEATGIYNVRIKDAIYRIMKNPHVSKGDKIQIATSLGGLPDNNIQLRLNDSFHLGLNLELKNSIGKLTPGQKKRSRLTPYVIARSFEEAEKVIKEMIRISDLIKEA